jgi:hypothetical protein
MTSLPAVQRWATDVDGRLKPLLHRLHIIPLETGELLVHCAQRTCWCCPKVGRSENGSELVTHMASNDSPGGWVIIGELDYDWAPGLDDDPIDLSA